MAKKTPLEADLARLKTKVREKRAVAGISPDDANRRALQKRLKRAQRKQRRLALRKQHGMGKQGGAPKTAGA